MTTARYADGTTISRGANGRPSRYVNPRNGVAASWDRNGRLASVSRRGPDGSRMNIRRGPGNERRIETTRTVPGGVEHVVSYGRGRGYVERPFPGRPGFVQRTVVFGGRSYGVVYHSYFYYGVHLYSPVPAVLFAPAFYGWMFSPWPAPIYYTPTLWGWAGQPWYGYYGGYFSPYPAYATPDQWLTDYVISTNLQAAYADQQAGPAPSGPPPPEGYPAPDEGAPASPEGPPSADNSPPPPPAPITDDEKAIMDQDVKDELAREQQQAAAGNTAENQSPPQIPSALQDHLFMVFAAPVQATLTNGQTCELADGDMLLRTGNSLNSDKTVDVTVKSSRADAHYPDLCPASAPARVQLADLQEMDNHKNDLLAQGEQKQADLMGKNQKHGGLPKGPSAQPTTVAAGQAPTYDQAMAVLNQQLSDADTTETQVATAASGG